MATNITSENVMQAYEQFKATAPQRKEMTDEERVQEVLSTPLFMSHLPKEDDVVENETLMALQSLTFDGTPEEIAENFKNQGNDAFKAGRRMYKDAITFYTKGLAAKGQDAKLNSVLYSNRAAVHLELSNFRQVLNDCARAIESNPTNIKAYFRSVKALYSLDRVDEGIDCCQRGLAIEPNNSSLKAELKKLQERKVVLTEMEAKRAAKEAKKLAEVSQIADAITSRGYRTFTTPADDGDDDDDEDKIKNKAAASYSAALAPALMQHPLAPSHKIVLDPATLHLKFPVLFLYPEFGQSDYIAEFDETDSFYVHFETMFTEPAPWDPTHAYHPQGLELYFETHPSVYYPQRETELVSVLRSVTAANSPSQSAAHKYVYTTLGDVLRHEKYRLVDGICTFMVVARGSDFAGKFRRQYRQG
ncbi:hypothetical protein BC831DRAFT_451011 [Entophlyctis helioformis]|nr:hypothetical protein BC831DRAFT_451011 [Entophlyctis helioformis]